MGKIDQIKQAIEDADNGVSKLTKDILDLPAFNTVSIKHLLNNLGGISTRYLEIGLHKAGGFISALYGNELMGVGVDNWSEFEQNGDSKRMAYENCCRYLDELKYTIRENDCFKLNGVGAGDINQLPIGDFDLYTYDGGHSFEQQYQGLIHFLPYMANEFIFCLDDSEWEVPKISTLKAIEDSGLTVLFHQHLFDGIMGGKYWNGFDVFLLKK